MPDDLMTRRQATLGPTYQNFFEQPLQILRGEGMWLWDDRGRKYLDCYNNVPSVGHCHPRVVEALTRQAATLNTHTRYLHPSVVELGEMLQQKLPAPIEVCVFACTGSEANDLAVQIARRVTGREGVVVCEASYHGTSELTRYLSTDSYPNHRRPDWLAVIEPPNLYRGPYRSGDPDPAAAYLELARIELDRLEQRGHLPAAVLIDLVWDSNGPLLPPTKYVQDLCRLVRERGGLVIADEVQSGYCRTGQNWWASHNFGIEPDFLTCGKPMGGGHPLALMSTTRDIAEAYAREAHYFNTFGGNPVSAEVGKAVIGVIEDENLLQNAASTGAYFESGLRELQQRHELIGDLQGCGLFWGLDMVSNRDTREPLPREQMRRLCSRIVEQGVVTGHSGRFGQILKLRPPLPFARDDADFALGAIDTALNGFEP